MESDLIQQAELLRSLHHGSQPLLLPNVWDVASARAVEAAGFPVVATSSYAIAESVGLDDSDSMPVEIVFEVIKRVARGVTVPVTADIEAGYQLPASDLVARLLDAGAVGCNLEDADHHGSDRLVPLDQQVERLRSIRRAADAAGVPLVINARSDVFLLEVGEPETQLDEAIRRSKAYLESGVDCLYPIGLTDASSIGTFVHEVGAPVNIWLRADGPSLRTLDALGVARVSLATGLFRRAMSEIGRALDELATQQASLQE